MMFKEKINAVIALRLVAISLENLYGFLKLRGLQIFVEARN